MKLYQSEIWKDIDYDIRYQVSNFGRFRKKLKKGYRYLKPFRQKKQIMWLSKLKTKI